MAAFVALILWAVSAASIEDQPLLIEVRRLVVPAGVHAIASTMEGGWYLSDQDRDLVLRWLNDGKDRLTAGGYGWGLSSLDRPLGLATDGARLYVADEGNHRVVEFDRDLRPLSVFSTRDSSDVRSRFGLPQDVALSSRGDLFVLDGESDEIVCFAAGRRSVLRIGRDVPGGTSLRSPTCIAVDDAEHLLIGESGGVRRLDLFGNQIDHRSLDPGVRLRGVAASEEWMAAISADTLYLFDPSGRLSQWSKDALSPGSDVGELRDVVWNRGILTILTEGLLLGFRIEY